MPSRFEKQTPEKLKRTFEQASSTAFRFETFDAESGEQTTVYRAFKKRKTNSWETETE